MYARILVFAFASVVAAIAVVMPALSATTKPNGTNGTTGMTGMAGMKGMTGMNTTKTIRIVMHDPGCHWFSVNGKLTTKLSVAGPVALANYDIATLKAAGPGSVKHAVIRHALGGKKVTLARGTYIIKMVNMPSDDNTLKLVVN